MDVCPVQSKAPDSRPRGNDGRKQTPAPTRLGDAVNFKRGYDLPEAARRPGPYPVISSAGISGYHDEYKVRGEGVVTGRYGTLGGMHYYNGDYWPHNTALYVTDFKGSVPKYIYYLLSGLGQLNTGDKSAVPGVNRNDLHELVIPLIVGSEAQQNIAAILSALDGKIDLNQRINAELEALAKTIYDYWFVQCDFPDAHGRPYKSSGGAMVWNDTLKRKIPAGWGAGILSDIADITMGQSPRGDSYNEEGRGVVFFQGSTDFGARSPGVRMYTTSPGRMARDGDILVSVRAPVGTLNIADQECCIGRGLAALNSKAGFDGYLYRVMADFKQIFDRRSSEGTTFGSITKDDLFGLKVLIPDKRILQAHARMANDWIQLAALRDKENRKLTRLRDWLLPLLMNGQVRVA